MSSEAYTPDRGTVRYRYVEGDYSGGNRDPHAEFDRFMAKIKADALREAAAELEDREHCYNDAMSAAFVPGETGRGNVIQSYEAILEEPYGWLRERADRIEEAINDD